MILVNLTNSPLIVEKLEKDWWRLDEPCTVGLVLKDEGVIRLHFKKGFKFNFRSGPQIIDSIIAKIDKFDVVWLMHDGGYTVHGLSRATWDDLMRQGLRLKGLDFFRTSLAYSAVRVFGGKSWDKVIEENNGKVSMTWNHK